jgi:hypothetical protein
VRFWHDPKKPRSLQRAQVAAVIYLITGLFWATATVFDDRGGGWRAGKGVLSVSFLFLGVTGLAATAWLRREQAHSD